MAATGVSLTLATACRAATRSSVTARQLPTALQMQAQRLLTTATSASCRQRVGAVRRSFSSSAEASEESHSDFQPIARHQPAATSSSTSTSEAAVNDGDIDSLSSEEVTQLIERDVSSSPVFLYMKGSPSTPRCGFSANVVRILQMCNVPFSARDVLSSEKLRQGIKQYSDWPTIPQLYVDGEFIGGSDIITNLYKSGELNQMLTKYQKQAAQ